jgi:hypothetical protein
MTVRGADYARRPGDDYATPSYVTKDLLDAYPELFHQRVLCDPAPGPRRAMVKIFKKEHCRVYEVPRRFDFITDEFPNAEIDVITNPPYGDRTAILALAFIRRALEVTKNSKGQVVMLLPFDFDCGKPQRNENRNRRAVFEHPAFAAKIVLPYRIAWFDSQSGSVEHAWFVWQWKNKYPPIIKYMPRRA